MWRIGVSDRSSAPKQRKSISMKRKPTFASINGDKLVGKMTNPIGIEGVGTTTDRPTRGSIVATEHLLMKRGSRESVTFTEAEFASLQSRDLSSRGSISGRLKTPETRRTSKNNSSTLTTVKQIQDRVKKVVNEYETGPYEDSSVDDNNFLLDIQLNLATISDDMLRINVGTLLDKYRKVAKQVRDESSFWEGREKNNKQELLESVQTWMEEERLDDLDDYEDFMAMPDTSMMEHCLDSIQDNVEKISLLQTKITRMKVVGSDTSFLERQKQNLQRQVKQEVLDNEYQWKKGSGHKRAEFSYLKNAATEIYNLVQRTRMEGMAQSHQFEEQLKELLEVMEEKEQHIEYLQNRVEQQKKLVQRWCNDYDKLQGDYIITKDEILLEKRNHLKLLDEIDMMKQQLDNQAEYHKMFIKKSEHEESIKEFENHIQALKQKMEVLNWTVREKDGTIDEHLRQIHRLKSVLRKGSLLSNSSEALTKSSTSLYNGKNQSFIANERSLTGLEISNPPPSPSRSWVKEDDSLRKRLEALEAENMELKMKAHHIYSSRSKHHHHCSGTPVGTQTDSYRPPVMDKRDDTDAVTTSNIGTQTFPTNSSLRTMTNLERKESFNVVDQMMKQYGTSWKDAALTLTKLKPEDITQIENAINTEHDMIRMFSGSPTKNEGEYLQNLKTSASDKAEGDEEDYEMERKENVLAAEIDVAPIQVSNSIQDLTEKMLAGDDPEALRETNTAGINDLLQEAETMSGKISNFVDKVQGYIGCQTGMMNEAIDKIKQMLPSDVVDKLEKNKASLEGNEGELSFADRTDEWQNMSISEQQTLNPYPPESKLFDKTIRNKLKYVEGAMKGMVTESMNVFIGEVAKQHAEYSEIHNTVKESPHIELSTLVSNPKLAVRDIQNKVEASVRYITRVSQAERRSMEAANLKNMAVEGGGFLGNAFMGSGQVYFETFAHVRLDRLRLIVTVFEKKADISNETNIHGRQVGATKAYDDRRHGSHGKVYPLHQQVKEKVGAEALQSLVSSQLAPKKNLDNSQGKKPRATPRDLQYTLRQQKRNRWKQYYDKPSTMGVSGMIGLVASDVARNHKPHTVSITRKFETGNAQPEYTGQPGQRRLGLANKERRKSNDNKAAITMLDIHNQINQQVHLNHPKQPLVQEGIANRIFPLSLMSSDPQDSDNMNFIEARSDGFIKDEELKLPKIL